MKFKAEIDHIRTLKKGSKIIFSLDDENTDRMMVNVQNFRKLPLIVEIVVDTAERKKQLAAISPEQRAKIYAIFNDIGEHVGDSADSVKLEMKRQYQADRGQDDFSLSDCPKELAGDFIEWLIQFCFEHGVDLRQTGHPRDAFDDIEVYMRLCLRKGVCCICGKPADTHHVDAIGMGRDRRTVDDSKHRKVALCRVHHTEAHQIGWQTFAEKYHFVGVVENA